MFGSIARERRPGPNQRGVRSWSTTITRMFGWAAAHGRPPVRRRRAQRLLGHARRGLPGRRRVRPGTGGGAGAEGSATSLATAAIAVPPSSAPPATTPPFRNVRLSIRRSGIGLKGMSPHPKREQRSG